MIVINYLCMYIYTHIYMYINLYIFSPCPWRVETGSVAPRPDLTQLASQHRSEEVRADRRQSFWPAVLCQRLSVVGELVRPSRRSASVARQRLKTAVALFDAVWETIHCTLNMHGQVALKRTKGQQTALSPRVSGSHTFSSIHQILTVKHHKKKEDKKLKKRRRRLSGTKWWQQKHPTG